MNVLFVNPDSQVYYREFVRGLKEVGARVFGLGHTPPQRLPPRLKPLLDRYIPVKSLHDPEQLLAAARLVGKRFPLERIETTDETLVVPTATRRPPASRIC